MLGTGHQLVGEWRGRSGHGQTGPTGATIGQPLRPEGHVFERRRRVDDQTGEDREPGPSCSTQPGRLGPDPDRVEGGFAVEVVEQDPPGSGDRDDLVGGVAGDHLDPGLGHVEHLLETHTVVVELAVLGLQGERHPRLDLDRVVE